MDDDSLCCEACGRAGGPEDCVPCKHSRWCKLGRCPLCFPTILRYAKEKRKSAEEQHALYDKFLAMEFVCEACAATGRAKGVPHGMPPFVEAGPLPGFRHLHLLSDGSIVAADAAAGSKRQQSKKQQGSAAGGSGSSKPSVAVAKRAGFFDDSDSESDTDGAAGGVPAAKRLKAASPGATAKGAGGKPPAAAPAAAAAAAAAGGAAGADTPSKGKGKRASEAGLSSPPAAKRPAKAAGEAGAAAAAAGSTPKKAAAAGGGGEGRSGAPAAAAAAAAGGDSKAAGGSPAPPAGKPSAAAAPRPKKQQAAAKRDQPATQQDAAARLAVKTHKQPAGGGGADKGAAAAAGGSKKAAAAAAGASSKPPSAAGGKGAKPPESARGGVAAAAAALARKSAAGGSTASGSRDGPPSAGASGGGSGKDSKQQQQPSKQREPSSDGSAGAGVARKLPQFPQQQAKKAGQPSRKAGAPSVTPGAAAAGGGSDGGKRRPPGADGDAAAAAAAAAAAPGKLFALQTSGELGNAAALAGGDKRPDGAGPRGSRLQAAAANTGKAGARVSGAGGAAAAAAGGARGAGGKPKPPPLAAPNFNINQLLDKKSPDTANDDPSPPAQAATTAAAGGGGGATAAPAAPAQARKQQQQQAQQQQANWKWAGRIEINSAEFVEEFDVRIRAVPLVTLPLPKQPEELGSGGRAARVDCAKRTRMDLTAQRELGASGAVPRFGPARMGLYPAGAAAQGDSFDNTVVKYMVAHEMYAILNARPRCLYLAPLYDRDGVLTTMNYDSDDIRNLSEAERLQLTKKSSLAVFEYVIPGMDDEAGFTAAAPAPAPVVVSAAAGADAAGAGAGFFFGTAAAAAAAATTAAAPFGTGGFGAAVAGAPTPRTLSLGGGGLAGAPSLLRPLASSAPAAVAAPAGLAPAPAAPAPAPTAPTNAGADVDMDMSQGDLPSDYDAIAEGNLPDRPLPAAAAPAPPRPAAPTPASRPLLQLLDDDEGDDALAGGDGWSAPQANTLAAGMDVMGAGGFGSLQLGFGLMQGTPRLLPFSAPFNPAAAPPAAPGRRQEQQQQQQPKQQPQPQQQQRQQQQPQQQSQQAQWQPAMAQQPPGLSVQQPHLPLPPPPPSPAGAANGAEHVSPVATLTAVLGGGTAPRNLMPTLAQLLERLGKGGLASLRVMLEPYSFRAMDDETRNNVEWAKQHGVKVFEPRAKEWGSPDAQHPPSSEVQVVLVGDHIATHGLEGMSGVLFLTEYLVAGAVVLPAAFLRVLRQTLGRVTTAHLKDASVAPFFDAGVVLVLDRTFCETATAEQVGSLMEALQAVKARGYGCAYARPGHLQLLHNRLAARLMPFVERKLLLELPALWQSNPLPAAQAAATGSVPEVLRDAAKVLFNINRPRKRGREWHPLRYAIVVAASPEAATALPQVDRAYVRGVLDNASPGHRTVIAATCLGAKRFLAQLKAQQRQTK